MTWPGYRVQALNNIQCSKLSGNSSNCAHSALLNQPIPLTPAKFVSPSQKIIEISLQMPTLLSLWVGAGVQWVAVGGFGEFWRKEWGNFIRKKLGWKMIRERNVEGWKEVSKSRLCVCETSHNSRACVDVFVCLKVGEIKRIRKRERLKKEKEGGRKGWRWWSIIQK